VTATWLPWLSFILVDSKGFWRWTITQRITGFFNFSHHPVILENRKHDVSETGTVSLHKWEENTYSVGSLRKS
jgi:hypothetical protein